jgi:hypothetical protein
MYQVRIFVSVVLLISSCSQQTEKGGKTNNDVEGSKIEEKIEVEERIEEVESNQPQELSSWQNQRVEKLTVKGYFPQFADHQTLLYSSNNYKGLWIYSLTENTATQISDEAGAGYMPVITGDTVIFQVKSRVKRLEMALVSTQKVIEQFNSNLSPQRYLEKQFAVTKPYASVAPNLLSIQIVMKEKQYEVAPNGTKNYLNASLSPNGEKLLYEVSGGEAHIADLAGNIKTSLGKIDAPKWVGNMQILYTSRKDDGMQTTSSQIYILDIENDTTFLLTDLNMIENPSSSPSGDIIVANTPDGDIYLIHKNK